MALILLHEHQNETRRAEVYKWANGICYEVKITEAGLQGETKHFNTEQDAENWAEDWVLEAKPKKTKKNSDE